MKDQDERIRRFNDRLDRVWLVSFWVCASAFVASAGLVVASVFGVGVPVWLWALWAICLTVFPVLFLLRQFLVEIPERILQHEVCQFARREISQRPPARDARFRLDSLRAHATWHCFGAGPATIEALYWVRLRDDEPYHVQGTRRKEMPVTLWHLYRTKADSTWAALREVRGAMRDGTLWPADLEGRIEKKAAQILRQQRATSASLHSDTRQRP